MEAKGWMMLQALLNRYHSGSSKPLAALLPSEESQEFSKHELGSNDVSSITVRPEDILNKVHYSWVAPKVLEVPEELRPFVLASMPEEYAAAIEKLLKMSSPRMSLSPSLKAFFLDLFFSRFYKIDGQTPVSFLPESKLAVLLKLSKQQLVEVIDFLGLYDLAEALRHIVDKQRLKRIYGGLSQKKQQYLRVCLHQKDRLVVPPLELDKWDGSIPKLEVLLHRRGLARFGVALSGQSPEFLSNIMQQLDSGRGSILQKYCKPKEVPNITSSVGMQVLNLVKFLTKEG